MVLLNADDAAEEKREDMKLPATQAPGQVEQVVEPRVLEKDPEGQGRQVVGEVAAVVLEKVPFWHWMHSLPKEKVPGEQLTQVPFGSFCCPG